MSCCASYSLTWLSGTNLMSLGGRASYLETYIDLFCEEEGVSSTLFFMLKCVSHPPLWPKIYCNEKSTSCSKWNNLMIFDLLGMRRQTKFRSLCKPYRQTIFFGSPLTWKVPLYYLNHEFRWRPESAFEPGSGEAYPVDQWSCRILLWWILRSWGLPKGNVVEPPRLRRRLSTSVVAQTEAPGPCTAELSFWKKRTFHVYIGQICIKSCLFNL